MSVKVSFTSEVSGTHTADPRPRPIVHHGVILQVGGAGERLVAGGAGETPTYIR